MERQPHQTQLNPTSLLVVVVAAVVRFGTVSSCGRWNVEESESLLLVEPQLLHGSLGSPPGLARAAIMISCSNQHAERHLFLPLHLMITTSISRYTEEKSS
jgi:hypothetical protein